jgi:hypothetical protein
VAWEDYVDDPFRARLTRWSAIVKTAWAGYGLLVVVVAALTFLAPRIPYLNWITVGLALIVAYATPVALLGGARIRRDLEARLSAAGIQYSGHPPTRSATTFDRWMTRNSLDPDAVRAALRQR